VLTDPAIASIGGRQAIVGQAVIEALDTSAAAPDRQISR
jgi:hypothetical protein